MPELPETETIARDLDREIRGRTIVDVRFTRPDVLREAGTHEFAERVRGARIERAWRRAKLVVLDLSTGDRIVVQPRFTGAVLIDRGALPDTERRYSTLAFVLDDATHLHYRDVRRLGTVTVMPPARWEAYSAGLGLEPLDPTFTPDHLSALLRGSRQAVKKLLMDQRRVVGLGNIYANESLWRARVDPARPARSLTADETARVHAAIVGVLTASIEARGTTFRDYVDATGDRGDFARQLAAYGRGGRPCLECEAELTETHALDGRSTVFCARCQR